jgi:16S rRNA (cytidine1402-2'-O)-methyltransferase
MFPNSISLAIALSGFSHDRFIFEGFIPARGSERKSALKSILSRKEMSVIMDTPYRLNSLVDEMKKISGERQVFIGLNLNHEDETLIRDNLKDIKLFHAVYPTHPAFYKFKGDLNKIIYE